MTLYGILALHASYLRLLPDKHMVRMIMELVQPEVLPLLPMTASEAGIAV